VRRENAEGLQIVSSRGMIQRDLKNPSCRKSSDLRQKKNAEAFFDPKQEETIMSSTEPVRVFRNSHRLLHARIGWRKTFNRIVLCGLQGFRKLQMLSSDSGIIAIHTHAAVNRQG
jgi:hypothetical protein